MRMPLLLTLCLMLIPISTAVKPSSTGAFASGPASR